jgi:ATP-binding protein involved in chromosome partitioning
MNVNVLGMIENMSTYICPNCGHEAHIFGHGGARADAERLGIPFLGEIPLDLDIRLASDGGAPIVATKPDSPQAAAFRTLARRLIDEGTI